MSIDHPMAGLRLTALDDFGSSRDSHPEVEALLSDGCWEGYPWPLGPMVDGA